MSAHTPTPWAVVIAEGKVDIATREQAMNPRSKHRIALVRCNRDVENAEHIVRCVNNHSALVDALRVMLETQSDIESIAQAEAVLAALEAS